MLRRKRFILKRTSFKNIIIISVLVISLLGTAIFSFKYMNVKVADKAQEQIEERLNNLDSEYSKQYLEEMMLKNKISFSKSYISNITFENDITLLTENGFHREVIDSTNRKNSFTEFFTQKKLTLIESYTAILSINSDDLLYEVNEKDGNVYVRYDKNKIKILSVEINNSTFFENNALFKNYSKEEYQATKQISKDAIKREVYNEKNKKDAEENLIKFLVKDAKKHGLDRIYINGELYNITFFS